MFRYALDAAALDWLVRRPQHGNDASTRWWRTQKSNDLYTCPAAFVPLFGYERSVPYPTATAT